MRIFAASSSENPLRMSRTSCNLPRPSMNRLKLRESAADVARMKGIVKTLLRPPQAPRIRCGCRASRAGNRPSRGPPQAPRIRCGCRRDGIGTREPARAASSSENPLRMSPVIAVEKEMRRDRLKLRESAADVARLAERPEPPAVPPQAPRIRCGCRNECVCGHPR